MSLLRALVLRPMVREKIRTTLTVLGIAVGVAVVVAIALSNQSALRAFRESVDAVAGREPVDRPAAALVPRFALRAGDRYRRHGGGLADSDPHPGRRSAERHSLPRLPLRLDPQRDVGWWGAGALAGAISRSFSQRLHHRPRHLRRRARPPPRLPARAVGPRAPDDDDRARHPGAARSGHGFQWQHRNRRYRCGTKAVRKARATHARRSDRAGRRGPKRDRSSSAAECAAGAKGAVEVEVAGRSRSGGDRDRNVLARFAGGG